MKLILSKGNLDVISARTSGIYGWKFPDGKWLVGRSTNVLGRIASYLSRKPKRNKKTSVAFDKYNLCEIEVYLLEEFNGNEKEMGDKEIEWSIKLDSRENGYNINKCGSCKRPEKRGVLKLLQMPREAVLTSKWLRSNGISSRLADYYVRSDMLFRVGDGAYSITQKPEWIGAVFGLSTINNSWHVGGISSFQIHGIAHYIPLSNRFPIYLFCSAGIRPPQWIKKFNFFDRLKIFPSKLFDTNEGIYDYRVDGISLPISKPERAILEFIYNMNPTDFDFEHANFLFENLIDIDVSLIQVMLEHCNSVKIKRLFLYFSSKHNHSWYKQINLEKIELGSGKISFVKGGRLNKDYLITVYDP